MLLNGGLGQPGDADAVAAHPERFVTAVFVGEAGLQSLGIFASQLEDVAHFDAPLLLQRCRRVVQAAFAGAGIAQVVGIRCSADVAPAAVAAVLIQAIGAAVEPIQIRCRAVGEAQKPLGPAGGRCQETVVQVWADEAQG